MSDYKRATIKEQDLKVILQFRENDIQVSLTTWSNIFSNCRTGTKHKYLTPNLQLFQSHSVVSFKDKQKKKKTTSDLVKCICRVWDSSYKGYYQICFFLPLKACISDHVYSISDHVSSYIKVKPSEKKSCCTT